MLLPPAKLEVLLSTKTARALALKPAVVALVQAPCFLCQWRVEAGRGVRGDCWLVTNLPTLFTFLLPRTRAERWPSLLAAFQTRLSFALLGATPPLEWRPLEALPVRGNPHSVIGCMNDMVNYLKNSPDPSVFERGMDQEDIINRRPYKSIGWKSPRQSFDAAMQQLVPPPELGNLSPL